MVRYQLVKAIRNSDKMEIHDLLNAVMQRYRE